MQKIKQQRKAAGLCVECGRALTEKIRCADCRKQATVYMATYRAKLKAVNN